MSRRLPARLGATVLTLMGEGYGLDAKPRPRHTTRFLAGEFGVITRIDPDWYRHYHVTLPPHADWPNEGERTFLFTRDEIMVLPKGTVPNTSAMDNHPQHPNQLARETPNPILIAAALKRTHILIDQTPNPTNLKDTTP